MTAVWALVVTRDRQDLLVECLGSLLAQTHALSGVIVFDNASSDGTAERLREEGLLDRPELRYVRSETNTGGAGGFANVLALGAATEAEWLWLMDDDAEPRLDALARLVDSPAAGHSRTAALCTAVVHGDGTLDRQHRCHLGTFITPLGREAYAPGANARVDCASFVGLLVRAHAARVAGLPRPEFFLGYDDAEYSLRLRELGEIRLVPESVITHKLVIGGGAATRRGAVWNRLLGADYTPSPWASYWKDLYRIRNFVALRTERDGLSDSELALVILGYAVKTLLYDRRPLRRLPWVVRFALKGRRGNFAAPSPESWASYALRR